MLSEGCWLFSAALPMHRRWITDIEWTLCFMCYRFPGKVLKGKKYKPLFQYFAKVCRLCALVPGCYAVLCIVCHKVKTDLCLTLITCLTTNWHLSLCSLNLSLNLSLTICGSICFVSSPLAPPFIEFSSSSFISVWGERSVPGGDG